MTRVICLYLGIISILLSTETKADLASYLKEPEPSFNLTDMTTIKSQKDQEIWHLNFDSLKWRSADEVSETQWSHDLFAIKPAKLKSKQAILIIYEGDNDDEPRKPLGLSRRLSQQTGAMVFELHQVPNQPLQILGGDDAREDALVAQSWDKYLKTSDPKWLVQYPMTKATIKAMDLIQSLQVFPYRNLVLIFCLKIFHMSLNNL